MINCELYLSQIEDHFIFYLSIIILDINLAYFYALDLNASYTIKAHYKIFNIV